MLSVRHVTALFVIQKLLAREPRAHIVKKSLKRSPKWTSELYVLGGKGFEKYPGPECKGRILIYEGEAPLREP